MCMKVTMPCILVSHMRVQMQSYLNVRFTTTCIYIYIYTYIYIYIFICGFSFWAADEDKHSVCYMQPWNCEFATCLIRLVAPLAKNKKTPCTPMQSCPESGTL